MINLDEATIEVGIGKDRQRISLTDLIDIVRGVPSDTFLYEIPSEETSTVDGDPIAADLTGDTPNEDG